MSEFAVLEAQHLEVLTHILVTAKATITATH